MDIYVKLEDKIQKEANGGRKLRYTHKIVSKSPSRPVRPLQKNLTLILIIIDQKGRAGTPKRPVEGTLLKKWQSQYCGAQS